MKNQIVLVKLEKITNELDLKIEEYATNIMGYPETQYMDVLYEEYAEFLESVKNKLEYIIELICATNESIQEKNKT